MKLLLENLAMWKLLEQIKSKIFYLWQITIKVNCKGWTVQKREIEQEEKSEMKAEMMGNE